MLLQGSSLPSAATYSATALLPAVQQPVSPPLPPPVQYDFGELVKSFMSDNTYLQINPTGTGASTAGVVAVTVNASTTWLCTTAVTYTSEAATGTWSAGTDTTATEGIVLIVVVVLVVAVTQFIVGSYERALVLCLVYMHEPKSHRPKGSWVYQAKALNKEEPNILHVSHVSWTGFRNVEKEKTQSW